MHTQDDNIIKKEFIRLGKYLNEITTVSDSTGKVLHKLVKPATTEFYLRDVIQVIVGATILAIPVAFTQEVWDLAESLPWNNIFALIAVSLFFISLFVYHNYYTGHFSKNVFNFLKRVASTYTLSLVVVAALMTIIAQADWQTLMELSLKKVFIVSLPASMSAVVSDAIK